MYLRYVSPISSDLLFFSAEALRSGTDGVRAVGWLGNDWSLERGDIVWNEGREK